MKDPFKRPGERMVALANVALPVVIDRAGGTLTVTTAEFDALRERFGGAVGVAARETAPGIFEFTLMPIEPRPEPLVD